MKQTFAHLKALVKSDMFRYERRTDRREFLWLLRRQGGFRVSVVYRVTRFCALNDLSVMPVMRVVQRASNAAHKCEIHFGTRIGPGLRLNHVKCTLVTPGSTLGAGVTLCHEVTLGLGDPSRLDSFSTLGDRVYVAPGAKILGAVVGSDVVIGANAVVTRDLPSGCVAAGAPARSVRRGDAANFHLNTDFAAHVDGLPDLDHC